MSGRTGIETVRIDPRHDDTEPPPENGHEEPNYRGLAQQYASLAEQLAHRDVERERREVETRRIAVAAQGASDRALAKLGGIEQLIIGRFDAQDERIAAIAMKIDAPPAPPAAPLARRRASSHDIDAEWEEQTDGGSRKLSSDQWQQAQREFAELRANVAAGEQAKLVAEAEARGAKNTLAELEGKNLRRRGTITFFLGLAVPAAGFAGWLLSQLHH
jgi:hypothetical protein